MLFWMTAKIDQLEFSKTHAAIELKLNELEEQLRLSTEDYSYWTLAYELVESGDEAEILENIGSGATDSALFDQLYILNATGDVLHAYDEDRGANAIDTFSGANFSEIFSALSATQAEDFLSVAAIVDQGEHLSLVAAAWITPDDELDRSVSQFPAMIGVIELDDDRLSSIMRDTGLSDIHIGSLPLGTLANSKLGSTILHDINGAPLANLAWTLMPSGTTLRSQLLPSVILLSLIVVSVCGLSARYFHLQHGALQQARQIARTDQLTGLLNRAGLAEMLHLPIIARGLDQGQLAVIYVDLNDFKSLNDTMGHQAGDVVLMAMAQRLQNAVRESDFVVRLGGDEFACLITDQNPEIAALDVSKRLLELSRAPITLQGHAKVVMLSVGVATATPGVTWETVLSQSDAAMFWAKQKGINQPVVYSEKMGTGIAAMPAIAS